MRNALIILALAALAGCEGRKAEAPAVPPPGEVWITPDQARQANLELAPVADSSVGGTVRTVGRLAFDDQRVTHVFSPVTGRISRLVVDLGQRVRPGQVLAYLHSPDMGSALSDLRKAEAALKAAEREYRRQKELLEGHAGAERDYEAAEAAWSTAVAERDRAKSKADLYHGEGQDKVSQGYELRAPIGGEIIAMASNPGLEVQGQYSGGATAELFTIGELDELRLLADVPEMDIPRVRVGGRIRYQVNGRDLEGTIDWVSGTLDPATRTVKVRCKVPNRDRSLKPEMFAKEVPGRMAPAVPRAALVRIGELTYAFVALGARPDGTLRFERRVVKGDEAETGDLVPVLSGLAAGDKVVVKGALQLSGVNG